MKFAEIAMTALATYRLSRLITEEDGPHDVFVHLRDRLGANDIGEDGRAKTTLGRVMDCPYCLSVYISLLFSLVILKPPAIVKWFILWWAIAGGQDILQTLADKGDQING